MMRLFEFDFGRAKIRAEEGSHSEEENQANMTTTTSTEKSESALDTVLKAYKIGNFPLALLICGLLIVGIGSPLSSVDSVTEILDGVDPLIIFLAGVSMMAISAIIWAIQTHYRQRLLLELTGCLQALIEGAGAAAKEGAGYDAALKTSLEKFKDVVKTFADGINPSVQQ